MQVVYLGVPPKAFYSDWEIAPKRLVDQPLFEVDVLFVFAGSRLEAEERFTYQLVERSGRPIIRVGAVDLPVDRRYTQGLLMVARYERGDAAQYEHWIMDRPRTNYTGVSESLVGTLRNLVETVQEVGLTMRRANNQPMVTQIQLIGFTSSKDEEYIQLADSCWIRLDRIIAIDGEEVSPSDRYH